MCIFLHSIKDLESILATIDGLLQEGITWLPAHPVLKYILFLHAVSMLLYNICDTSAQNHSKNVEMPNNLEDTNIFRFMFY